MQSLPWKIKNPRTRYTSAFPRTFFRAIDGARTTAANPNKPYKIKEIRAFSGIGLTLVLLSSS
jgi:hypothetical protein